MKPQIIVVVNYETLSRHLASFFCSEAFEAIEATGKFTAALSGGATPKLAYQLLGQDPFKSQIPWEHVHFFWGDERCVSPDDSESNFKMANDALFFKIKIPGQNLHRMKGELAPETAASLYEKELQHFFGKADLFPKFDFVLLGLGQDGHTASLFPGTSALLEKEHWVVANPVEKLQAKRLTLTFPVINSARNVAFLVSGADKSKIIPSIMSGDAFYPASRICPDKGKLFWFLDREAASKLKVPS